MPKMFLEAVNSDSFPPFYRQPVLPRFNTTTSIMQSNNVKRSSTMKSTLALLRFLLGAVVVAQVCSIEILDESPTWFTTAANYFRQQIQDHGDDPDFDDAYPLHDAIVAAFLPHLTQSPSNSVSMEEMEDMLRDCSDEQSPTSNNNQDLMERFRSAVPSIINKAIRRFDTDTGRVLEITDGEEFRVGENYYINVKSASLSCFVTTAGIESTNPLAAYASYVIAPMEGAAPVDPMAYSHNLTMFIEADVMEMPENQLYFIPKRFCLEGLDVEKEGADKHGMSAIGGVGLVTPSNGVLQYAPLDKILDFKIEADPIRDSFVDTIPNTGAATENTRTIALGARQGVLRTRLNRLGREIAWGHMVDEYNFDGEQWNYEFDLLLNSYLDPKLELWGLHAAKLVGLDHECFSFSSPPQITTCLQQNLQMFFDNNGIDMEALYEAALSAVVSYAEMREYAREWRAFLKEKYGETSDGLEPDILRSQRFVRYPVPYIFDRNIAMYQKNSPFPATQVNPYSYGSATKYLSSSEDNESTQCHEGHIGNFSAAPVRAAAAFYNSLIRRFEERNGTTQPLLSDWAISSTNIFTQPPSNLSSYDLKVAFDDEGNLLPGNLTSRQLGRTAKWLMVVPWYNTVDLQDLIHGAQTSKSLFSKVTTEIYDGDNPCGDAATDTEIFLFVFSIVLAGFGAVSAILKTVHQCFHWWAVCCCGPKTDAQSGTQQNRRSIPCFTYEMFFVFLGTAVFIGLFAPLFVQVLKEIEVSRYKQEAVTVQLDFADYVRGNTPVYGIGQAAVITFVQAESYCKTARPNLLILLLVVGFVVSASANAPYIVRAIRAVKRSCWRQSQKDLAGVTIYDEELTTLNPAKASDFDSRSLRERASGSFPWFFRPRNSSRSVGGSNNASGSVASSVTSNGQASITSSSIGRVATTGLTNDVNDLKTELKELQYKCDKQVLRMDELTGVLQSLQKKETTSSTDPSKNGTMTKEAQPQSGWVCFHDDFPI